MTRVSRTTLPLTLDRLASVEGHCASCLWWETTPVRRRQLDHLTEPERRREKEAWVSQVLREWGSCGRVAVADGETVGLAVYAPAHCFPGAAVLPTAPVSPDAVLLSTVWVDPRLRGGGIGRLLVQGMARDLLARDGFRSVEAFGATGRGPRGSHEGCVVPAEFLARVGFKTQRAHALTPRLRMELSSAVTWRDEVGAAWERLLGVVRPRHPATPTSARAPR